MERHCVHRILQIKAIIGIVAAVVDTDRISIFYFISKFASLFSPLQQNYFTGWLGT
jgi:hypothetical protein